MTRPVAAGTAAFLRSGVVASSASSMPSKAGFFTDPDDDLLECSSMWAVRPDSLNCSVEVGSNKVSWLEKRAVTYVQCTCTRAGRS